VVAALVAAVFLVEEECQVVGVQVTAGNDRLLNTQEEALLVQLISELEKKTTAEIRIHIAKRVSKVGPFADAKKIFSRLGMHKTSHRNGVLIFVAAIDRKMCIFGDQGIHEKVGDQFWKEVVAEVILKFKKQDYFFGFKHALEQVGKKLEENFPNLSGEFHNELPNDISKDS
jgi:uncharacterized membrane protein